MSIAQQKEQHVVVTQQDIDLVAHQLIQFGGSVEQALSYLTRVANLEIALELLGFGGENGAANLCPAWYDALEWWFVQYGYRVPHEPFRVDEIIRSGMHTPDEPAPRIVTPLRVGQHVQLEDVIEGICVKGVCVYANAHAGYVVLDVGRYRETFDWVQ